MAGAPSSIARRLLLLLTVSCCLCLCLFRGADAARHLLASTDADALLQIKSGIKDGKDALRSWKPGTTPCNGDTSNWEGVICDKGNVLGLQMEKMGLAGTLDLRPLKSLGDLRTLSFMDNEFAGQMPELNELPGLRSVFLSGNKFSGEIPADAFAGMGSLKKVYLARNSFSGPIPSSLADVPRLLELKLNDNKFQGKIPDLRQKELKLADVANNELDGEVPASLKSLKPDMFAGNKKLCGAPLNAKCEAPAETSPTTTSTKVGSALPSPNAPTTGTPADAAKATEESTSSGVLVAFLGTMAIIGFAFVALQRRRDNTQNFGPTITPKPSMQKLKPELAKDGHVSPRGSAASSAAGAADGSTAKGGAARKAAAEQGRLTFVRDDRGRFFELQDLLKATAEVLGVANLGVCYRATLPAGQSVVVKRFKEMNRVGKEDFEEHMRRLGRLSHPNLLPLVAYYYRKEEKLLIHDYVPNRSLAHLLHGEGRGNKKAALHWTARLKIVKGVTRGLSYLYDELPMLTVPHGHLKSSNILLDAGFEPQHNDYALVPVMNQSHSAQLMVAFKSPERKQFGRSSKKSDVWCLGLLILEVITGKPPSYEVKPDQPPPPGTNDLVGLVGSTPEEQWVDTLVDGDLRKDDEDDREEMVNLIKIGLACCESNVETRWDLKNAVDRIEELKGKEHANDQISDGDARDEDFANVAI